MDQIKAVSRSPSQFSRSSGFAKEASLDTFIQRQFGTAIDVIGDPGGVLRDQRQRPRPAGACLVGDAEEEISQPILPGMDSAKVAIMLRGPRLPMLPSRLAELPRRPPTRHGASPPASNDDDVVAVYHRSFPPKGWWAVLKISHLLPSQRFRAGGRLISVF